MTPNERILRRAMSALLQAISVYSEEVFYSGSDDEDEEVGRAAKKVDKAVARAHRALRDTDPPQKRQKAANPVAPQSPPE